MDPRPRRAGGVAVALLLVLALATASPASAQVQPALQLDDLCWMGPNRPIVRARNLGDQPLPYTMRSGPAMRSGTLAGATPSDDGESSAYFVASGRFPDVEPVQLRATAADRTETDQAGAAEARHCSYALRPVVQWYDADGAPVPPPASAPGVVTLSSSLGRLVCDGVAAELSCVDVPVADAPLPAGSFAIRPGELAVPAFAVGGVTPTFTVTTAAPDGFRPDGTGTFNLADLGSGLGQANVDERLRPFFVDDTSSDPVVREVVVAMRRHEPQQPVATVPAPPGSAVTPPHPPSTVVVSSGRPTPTSQASPGSGPSKPVTDAARTAARDLLPWTGWSSVALLVAAAAVALALSWLLGGRRRRPWNRWSWHRRPAHDQRDRTERPMVGVASQSYRRPRG